MDKISQGTILILAGAVDAGNVLHTERHSITDRYNDTVVALDKWVKSGLFDKIVVFDSSGYDLDALKDRYNNKKILFEFISENLQDFDRSLGKGHGTYVSIKYLMSNSNLYNNAERVVIVSARYYIKNAKKIIESNKSEINCDINLNLSYAFNPMIIAKKQFIDVYWNKFISATNDTKGLTFEHCFAKAILRAISDGYSWELPSEAAHIDAISGCSNEKYYRGFIHWHGLKYYSWVKKFVFEFKR
jgi:hypothetical protein